jgi:hypothetical protein
MPFKASYVNRKDSVDSLETTASTSTSARSRSLSPSSRRKFLEDFKRLSHHGRKWTPAPHHCPICEKPSTDKNSLKRCLWTHTEVCNNYHQTLFRIGEKWQCEACENEKRTNDDFDRKILRAKEKGGNKAEVKMKAEKEKWMKATEKATEERRKRFLIWYHS